MYRLSDITKHLGNIYEEEELPLMSMQDWVDQTNQFLSNNRRKVLEGKGRISHEQAIEKAAKEYDIFRIL